MKYENLFKKGKIGKLEIKNRIVMPAMGTSLATSTGEASDEIIKYYEERAKGGCGLIITEITRIDNETGIGTPNQLCATDAYQVPRLEKLARAIHRHDSKIFLQLHHPGRQSHGELIGGKQIVAPSSITCKTIGEEPRELTIKEVEELVKKFIKGAKIAEMSGIDGVELHAAHGYLIGQFISPLTNIRTDKYGGDFKRRMNFITEIILGIKRVCGKDFPISVRIDGDEFVEGGLTLEESVKACVYLESIGVDAINVSSGTYESGVTIIEPISYPQGWKRHLAQTIKDSINIPVIACDVIRKPDFAEKLIEERNVDFVAIGRGLLADAEWGKKAKERREKEIRPCISCLYCIEQLSKGSCTKCAVNPRMGRELEYNKIEKNGEGRLVVVIGGGPAGMEAARISALKGFKVILFEKKDVLGGSVYLGSKPPLKEKLNWLLDNMEYQIKELGVEIRLNTSPTIKDLEELNPYAVFLATGAESIVPNIPGINKENVYTVIDVLEEKIKIINSNVVVIGSGLTGLETAEYIADKGNKVTVIEMLDKIGGDAYASNLYDVTSRLKKYGVEFLTSTKLIGIEDENIKVESTINGEVSTIKADNVILSLGVRSRRELLDELEEHFSIVKVVGDTYKPGRIANAIHTGFEKAYVLE
ncbi:NAD(P)/FAD-dependent oxidoreductase [Clostridium cochlearium]|uniref:2,4-dienoyl-CoA reductase n=1 Tax=Clostridium cochlearium TaxID=1494 RepID=A0ABY0QNF3_CLOCO|nr:NAD(P)/FAD-dependent oxidoreductase [Clostridium cochlearium]NME96191.1 FAD-dependent oxidoreductase [Clostridium cochlearium]SDL37224.1 2,4-dienoyl-CoA reductase [Clostridium cochlearium]SNV74334.1 enoate reductase [Clostridium cochlearium]STA92291.1 enoate reductase [Clostridium cochlearium]